MKKNQLLELQKTSKAIDLLKQVNEKIPEKKLHDHSHILYDIRTLLGDKEKDYLEIGIRGSSTASLILHNPYKTKLLCVDPCILNKDEYNGEEKQYPTIIKNLKTNNKNNYTIQVEKSFATDPTLLNYFINIKIQADILFFNGGTNYDDIMNTWNEYKGFLNPGGFIVFNNYNKDYIKSAVDDMVKTLDSDEFEIIGRINIDSVLLNQFIIYRQNRIWLEVSQAEKTEARRWGVKYDWEIKNWYIPENASFKKKVLECWKQI
jgi:hypothetical protein